MVAVSDIDVSIGLSADLPVAGFLDVARSAAAMGYRRVWIGETFKLDPLIFMTRVHAELPDLQVGIGPMPSLLRTGPQLAMAAGSLILLIAFIDELVLEWRGQRVQASSDEALHNE